MATNERVTNESADDGRYIADADPQNILIKFDKLLSTAATFGFC